MYNVLICAGEITSWNTQTEQSCPWITIGEPHTSFWVPTGTVVTPGSLLLALDWPGNINLNGDLFLTSALVLESDWSINADKLDLEQGEPTLHDENG